MSNTRKTLGKTRGLIIYYTSNLVCFLNWHLLFGAEMNEVTGPFRLSVDILVYMCQGSLGAFVILIFWFANRQEKIDEEFGFSAKEGMTK